jgi:DNA polymerase-3 subunit delta'
MSAPFPWQEQQWQHLWSVHKANRLPHALLLEGPYGMGISRFALDLARALLCDAPLDRGAACNRCKNCLLQQAGNHPEILQIGPEEKGKLIRIDQIRELIQFVSLKSHYGHLRIVLLDPAEAMNRNAANSLLKTLEEPPSGTLFILVSHSPMLLPVTVRSRCQPIHFTIPAEAITQQWLMEQTEQRPASLFMFADEAPLTLLEGLESGLYTQRREIVNDLESLLTGASDPLAIAQHWSRLGAEEVLLLCLRVIESLIKLKSTQEPSWISNLGMGGHWHAWAEALDLFKLFTAYDRLMEYRQLLAGQANITALNLLEEFAIQWTTILGKT